MADKHARKVGFSMLVEDLRDRGTESAKLEDTVPEIADEIQLRVVWTIAAWFAALVLIWLALPAGPPPAARVRADLLHVLERSRAAIEQGRGRDGELPVQLPEPSLASVVAYRAHEGSDEYDLRVSLAGQTIVWRSRRPGIFEESHQ